MHPGSFGGSPEKKRPEGFSGLSMLRLVCFYGMASADLEFSHSGSLRTFGATLLVKGHPVTFGQRFEPAAFDGAEVHENVMSAVTFDEAVTLAVIEPFHSTFRHVAVPFLFDFVVNSFTGALLWGNYRTASQAKDRSSMQLKIPNQAPFLTTLVDHPQKASQILLESP